VPRCANGIDDDGDGAIDYPADLGCASIDSDTERSHAPACGLGFEIAMAMALPHDLWRRHRRPARRRAE
jgi:hypothetical protein